MIQIKYCCQSDSVRFAPFPSTHLLVAYAVQSYLFILEIQGKILNNLSIPKNDPALTRPEKFEPGPVRQVFRMIKPEFVSSPTSVPLSFAVFLSFTLPLSLHD